MSLVDEFLSWPFLIAGSFFLLVGAFGLVRMPDFFTRLHPAGLVDTLGAGSIVVGLMFEAGFSQASLKLLLIPVFLFFTTPTANHAVSHAALVDGVKPWTRGKEDDSS